MRGVYFETLAWLFCFVESELEQFAVDSGRTPEGIVTDRFAYENPDFGLQRCPILPSISALPLPEKLESRSVPADNRLVFYDDQRVSPSSPKTG